jgi:hypothetical protein
MGGLATFPVRNPALMPTINQLVSKPPRRSKKERRPSKSNPQKRGVYTRVYHHPKSQFGAPQSRVPAHTNGHFVPGRL